MTKIGRNDPCPCGSGHKFKKCCGSGSSNVHSAPPAAFSRKVLTTHEDFEREIENLKRQLAKYKLSSLLMSEFTALWTLGSPSGNSRTMTSPYKQCTYMASLALEVPANSNARDLKKGEWEELCALSETIFNYYSRVYFDEKYTSEEKRDLTRISMVTFMTNLGTGMGITVEQIRKDISDYYLPFDREVQASTGLSINSMLELSDLFVAILQGRLDNGLIKFHDVWEEYRAYCAAGIDSTQAMKIAKGRLSKKNTEQIQLMGCVLPQELYDTFDKNIVDKYLVFLSQERATSNTSKTLYPSEQHSIEQKPIVKEDGKYSVMTPNLLYTAILGRIEELIMADQTLYSKYNSHVGHIFEDKMLVCLRRILGTDARYYQSLFTTPNSQHEHDIVILIERTILIVECKAKHIRKNFRDPERAFLRIKQDFEVYIQEGCDQAIRLKEFLSSQDQTMLYDRKGKVVLELSKKDYDFIECMCVTKDNEGALATDLSLLLSKDDTSDYPYCINSLDLRQLAELKEHFNITPSMFLQYLRERKLLHGKVMSDDELDFWGYYIKTGSFREYIEKPADFIILDVSSSSIFSEAYRLGKYVPL